MQVKTKLILSLSLILMISFVLTSIINYRLSRDSILREIMTSSLPLTSENIYSLIHSDLLKPINVSSLMANDTFLRNWAMYDENSTEKVIEYLATIQKRYGYFAAFFVSAQTERYYYPGGILKKISQNNEHDNWYFSFLESKKKYALSVDTNEAENNNLTIFINFRLEDGKGNLLGVTGVGLEMNRVSRLLKDFQRTYDRNIYLVDRKGIIKAHTNSDRINSSFMAPWKDCSVPKNILTPWQASKQYEFDCDNQHVLLSVRYMPEFDWFLIVQQDEFLALSTARSNLIRTLWVGLVATIIVIFLTVLGINHYQRRLERIASTDELTGMANRREFGIQFDRAVHRFDRSKVNFSILLFDIDGLKGVNDTLGHLAGDEVIKSVSNITNKTVRACDIVARWGGDEFIVLIEGDIDTAKAVAERVRESIEATNLLPSKQDDTKQNIISVSCGASQYRYEDDLDSITLRADQAMYTAKRQGKNAVIAS